MRYNSLSVSRQPTSFPVQVNNMGRFKQLLKKVTPWTKSSEKSKNKSTVSVGIKRCRNVSRLTTRLG